MSAELPVALVLILGGLGAALVPIAMRRWLLAALPCLAAAGLLTLEPGTTTTLALFGFELQPVRVDRLSLIFGYIFCIAAFLYVLFAWHAVQGVEQPAGMVYAGAAIGAVFAGDLLTLFVYWEATAVAS